MRGQVARLPEGACQLMFDSSGLVSKILWPGERHASDVAAEGVTTLSLLTTATRVAPQNPREGSIRLPVGATEHDLLGASLARRSPLREELFALVVVIRPWRRLAHCC